jgi:hypothetical protein
MGSKQKSYSMGLHRYEYKDGYLGICQYCFDKGCVVMTVSSISAPWIKTSKMVCCPVCMPTKQYGNVQKELEDPEKLKQQHLDELRKRAQPKENDEE